MPRRKVQAVPAQQIAAVATLNPVTPATTGVKPCEPVILVLESPRLWLTIKEAAQYLRVGRRTMSTLVKSKQVKFARVRGGLRFRLQWLNDYLDRRTVEAAA